MDTEIWKSVPSEPGYEVSNLGRVRSTDRIVMCSGPEKGEYPSRKPGRILRPGRAKSGHMTVACGRNNSRYVHTLVLEAFVGPAPNGMECLHKDDIASDNRLERLRWGTRSENMKELWANGRRG